MPTPANRPIFLDKNNLGSGVFSNTVNVAMTPREMVLDFGLIGPPLKDVENNEGILVGRMILTIDHAKELRDVLVRTLNEEK